MKVLLLAAGQGKRMLPLSLTTPKPLLYVGKYRLIEHHLIKLAKAGFKDVLINLNYKSQDFPKALGCGRKYNLKITYSYEKSGLEAGGTIITSRDFFDQKPFLMISSDIFTSYNFKNLKTLNPEIAHLLLIDNNQSNDFNFINGKTTSKGSLSYANIGVFNPTAFSDWPQNCKIKLSYLLNYYLTKNKHLDAEIIKKPTIWHNVSNPTQLKSLNEKYQAVTG